MLTVQLLESQYLDTASVSVFCFKWSFQVIMGGGGKGDNLDFNQPCK
jgi:hypothetical protein